MNGDTDRWTARSFCLAMSLVAVATTVWAETPTDSPSVYAQTTPPLRFIGAAGPDNPDGAGSAVQPRALHVDTQGLVFVGTDTFLGAAEATATRPDRMTVQTDRLNFIGDAVPTRLPR